MTGLSRRWLLCGAFSIPVPGCQSVPATKPDSATRTSTMEPPWPRLWLKGATDWIELPVAKELSAWGREIPIPDNMIWPTRADALEYHPEAKLESSLVIDKVDLGLMPSGVGPDGIPSESRPEEICPSKEIGFGCGPTTDGQTLIRLPKNPPTEFFSFAVLLKDPAKQARPFVAVWLIRTAGQLQPTRPT